MLSQNQIRGSSGIAELYWIIANTLLFVYLCFKWWCFIIYLVSSYCFILSEVVNIQWVQIYNLLLYLNCMTTFEHLKCKLNCPISKLIVYQINAHMLGEVGLFLLRGLGFSMVCQFEQWVGLDIRNFINIYLIYTFKSMVDYFVFFSFSFSRVG